MTTLPLQMLPRALLRRCAFQSLVCTSRALWRPQEEVRKAGDLGGPTATPTMPCPRKVPPLLCCKATMCSQVREMECGPLSSGGLEDSQEGPGIHLWFFLTTQRSLSFLKNRQTAPAYFIVVDEKKWWKFFKFVITEGRFSWSPYAWIFFIIWRQELAIVQGTFFNENVVVICKQQLWPSATHSPEWQNRPLTTRQIQLVWSYALEIPAWVPREEEPDIDQQYQRTVLPTFPNTLQQNRVLQKGS